MFACIAPYFAVNPPIFVRTSWFQTIEAATEHAGRMLGVVAVEEIGRGVVWHDIETAPEFASAGHSPEDPMRLDLNTLTAKA